ncbi:protease inhibitor I42 family protein [Microbacterium sp. M28]|uniref:protease inhibitor I42 family protein n=1 Tax=Microbacterium sp. M28 TaxID=2962064 RepID=UPI0021F44A61|nr:protease inhibitor I42 family protein [Microbacterium sp. M28]UYO98384.1 protease inhibitor I42 family protein [Microbacterium sp. M28]
MRAMTRFATAMVVAMTAAVALSGCAASDEVVVEYSEDVATLSIGDILVVDFGEINSSVGDGWVIVSPPDPAVLGEGVEASEYLGEEGSTGAANRFAYRFEAVGEGRTTVEFEYRFRGEVPEDPGEQETAMIEVTVR